MRIVKTLLFASAALYFSSCQKTEAPTESLSLSRDVLAVTAADDSLVAVRTKLLTDSTWRYYEYYTNFNVAASKLIWKFGRTSNTLNLSLNRTKFNTNGTYTETTETGAQLPGSWAFLNGGTQLQTTNSYGTFVSNIRVLTANRFEWQASDGSNYGVELASFPTTDYTQTALALLTGKTWKYESYFLNYPLASADLAWYLGKPIVSLNLSLNRVTYNTNGTYSEIDQNGNTVTGTWQLLNSGTRLSVTPSSSGIAFVSDIKVLNATRLEWNRIDNNYYYYGSMIPQ
jgi:hypothetical protein